MPGYRHYNLKDDEFKKYDILEDFETTYENYELSKKSRRQFDLFLAILLNVVVLGCLIKLIIDL